MRHIRVPVAPGELIDKITILEIKSRRIGDERKLRNVRYELELLNAVWDEVREIARDISYLRRELSAVNEKLWELEDNIRELEARRDFGEHFVELARSVYLTNDERVAIKREINTRLGSGIMEEKSYTAYGGETTSNRSA